MSQQTAFRLILADDNAAATNPISLAVQGCDLLGTPEFGEDPGTRGTRQRYDCGARLLKEVVDGGFEFQPTAAQLDWVLSRCFGTSSGSPWVPAETIPKIYAFADKVEEKYRYDDCYIARVGFTLRQNDYLKVRLDLVGGREVSGITWPVSPPAIGCASEFVASDVAFNLAATAYSFKSLDWFIDNRIAPDQHENKIYRTVFESEGLDIGINGNFAWRSDTKALYRRAIAGDASTIVMGDGAVTYTFSFPNVKIPGRGPTVPNQGEITQMPTMKVFRTTGSPMMTVTKV